MPGYVRPSHSQARDRRCRDTFALLIRKRVTEDAARLEMRIVHDLTDCGHDRAAAVPAGKARVPGLRALLCNDLGTTACGTLRIAPVIAQPGVEPDNVAELFPELLLKRSSGNELVIARGIEMKARRSPGQELTPIGRL